MLCSFVLAVLFGCSDAGSGAEPVTAGMPAVNAPATMSQGVQAVPPAAAPSAPQPSGTATPPAAGAGSTPPASSAGANAPPASDVPGVMDMPMGGAPPGMMEEEPPPASGPDPVPDAGAPRAGSDAPGVPIVPTPDRPLVGVYVGNDAPAVGRFETWLGHPVDAVLGYTGNASWEDYDGSVGWAVGLWKDIDRRILWSVPLIPTGANLEDAAAGKYDDHYRKAAQTLASYRPQDAELFVRTGWEFNGDWFPWAAKGKGAAFAGAFRHFVMQFRSVSDRFVFDWNVNVGDVGMNPEEAYPGDDYVDIVSMDFYWNTQWDPADPQAAWDSMLNRKWGLMWHQTFAKAHGKRMAYAEWGVMSNNAGPYIERARAWFEQHDVVYHTYWDSNLDFKGKLSANQYPQAGSAYRAAFPAP